jgi:S-(hydroxymethyl)glutathione dehydrogenase/alcohol dehydrogenase
VKSSEKIVGPVGSLTSRAAISDGSGGFVVDTTQVAAPAAGEVRVRLIAAGICHTDQASLLWPGPLVLGHEGAGVVESVGAGVSGLAPGTTVLLNWAIPCGLCPQCKRGRGSLCERTHGIDPKRNGSSRARPGHTLWQGAPIERSFNLGTFAEFTLVRAEALIPLPAIITPQVGCILGCGVMTGVGSVVNIAEVQQGDTVVVVGCGGVGLSVVQGARLVGASRIVAIDQRPVALERAATMGATDLLRVDAGDREYEQLSAHVRGLTDGRGVDHAFEATGIPALAFLPLRLVRNGGTAVQVSGAHGPVAVPLPWFMWDKRYLTPLYGGCHPARDFPRLFAWVASGDIDIASMVSHTYSLDELGSALADMLAGRCTKGVLSLAA